MRKQRYRVVSDAFSDHGLPVGTIVTATPKPPWCTDDEVRWFTCGGDGDEVAIDERDIRPADPRHIQIGTATIYRVVHTESGRVLYETLDPLEAEEIAARPNDYD